MALGLHAKGSLIFLVPLAGKTQNFKLEGTEVLKKKKNKNKQTSQPSIKKNIIK